MSRVRYLPVRLTDLVRCCCVAIKLRLGEGIVPLPRTKHFSFGAGVSIRRRQKCQFCPVYGEARTQSESYQLVCMVGPSDWIHRTPLAYSKQS
jgi:hypothetical protein